MIRFLQSTGATRKGLLWAFILFICVSMVAFLGNYFISDANAVGTDGTYATVGRQVIRTAEVREEAQRGARQLTRGQPVPESFLSYFNKRAAGNLILNAALIEEADRMGLTVSDEELAQELRKSPFFSTQLFPGGQFVGKDAYRNFVFGNYQMEVPVFESLLKKSLLINKLRMLVEGGVTVSPDDIQKAYQQQNVKVKFDYAVLSTADLAKNIKATESELKAYFEQAKAKYENSIPEKRKAVYVLLETGKLPVQISEDDYKRFYDTHKSDFEAPEEVDVRHILVKTKELALDVKKQLDAGAKFEDLAKKYSEDPGSKDNGGLYARPLRQRGPQEDGAGVRCGRILPARGQGQRSGADQLRIPHPARGRASHPAFEAAGRSESADRAAAPSGESEPAGGRAGQPDPGGCAQWRPGKSRCETCYEARQHGLLRGDGVAAGCRDFASIHAASVRHGAEDGGEACRPRRGCGRGGPGRKTCSHARFC
ncbi:MAG: SurA N-terminal domain-containing protein [Acidobacteriales bacterium]|nr:SurA N-terminal domain-containing protein [Terriglobales bacterium]